MKILYILPTLLLFSLFASAQNEEDALRFSRLTPFGSARVTAMGGAFGALGGDLTTLSTNPGGIEYSVNLKSVLHPCSIFAHAKTKGIDNEKNMYLLGGLGFVLSFQPMSNKWKNINIGFNYTNLNNFNRNIFQGYYETNGDSSLSNIWKEEADGLSLRKN